MCLYGSLGRSRIRISQLVLLRRLTFTGAPRRPYVILGLTGLVAGVGLFVSQHLPQDSPTRATVSQVLGQFRRAVGRNPSRGKVVHGLPAPGVYRYETRGREDFNGLLNASHPYHGVSSIAVTSHSCGIAERWQVLSKRWTSSVICQTGPRIRFVWLDEQHEFFGTSKETSYICARGSKRHVTQCRSKGNSLSNVTKVIDIEPIEIDGRAFEAVHRRSAIRFSGESSGQARSDEWRRRSDELLLQKRFISVASVDAGGGGTYRERYWLKLLSSQPRR